jgi:hypothetical protein
VPLDTFPERARNIPNLDVQGRIAIERFVARRIRLVAQADHIS